MKPLRISQKQYFAYQANGLWFYMLAIRQILFPLILFLYIYPGLAWHSQELLAGSLLYFVVMAAFFFLRKKAFVVLYIIQAVVVTGLILSLLYQNPSGFNLKLLSLLIFLDIGFIISLFTSRQAAVAFRTRKLEITDQDLDSMDASDSRAFRRRNRLISGGVFFVLLAIILFMRQAPPAAPSSAPQSADVNQEYVQAQLALMEQLQSQSQAAAHSSSAYPSPSWAGAAPTPLPSPRDYLRYNVLRRGAEAPMAGSYDPLKLTYDSSCLGDDMDMVLRELSTADYTNNGNYEFYPKFDYLGLGWETNRVFIGAKSGKVSSLTYSTQTLHLTKPVEFLYAAETMHDQLIKMYGKPNASNFTDPAEGTTNPMDVDQTLLAMRKGKTGICSFEWDLTGLKISLNFTNQYQGPKTGHYELTFEAK